MNINILTDEELAQNLLMALYPGQINYAFQDKKEYEYFLKIAKFIRQCVKDSQKELVTALKNMIRTHGMHGPCEYNNCGGCDYAYKKAQNALRAAMEGKDNEEN